MLTLLSDMGWSHYSGQMRGVVFRIHPGARIVDITHEVEPGNIKQGAFLLWAAVPHFPQAVHVAVVDPGVGTDRQGLAIQTHQGTLVGPDNGLLIPAAQRMGIVQVRRIENRGILRPEVSATFHGRDVFAPVGAHLDRGLSPDEVGPRTDKYVELKLDPEKAGNGYKGEILHVDRFGNLITNIPHSARIKKWDTTIGRKRKKMAVAKTFAELTGKQPGLIHGSSGMIEVVVNGGSAAKAFTAKLGTAIRFVPA